MVEHVQGNHAVATWLTDVTVLFSYMLLDTWAQPARAHHGCTAF